jgi:hypothetical protein
VVAQRAYNDRNLFKHVLLSLIMSGVSNKLKINQCCKSYSNKDENLCSIFKMELNQFLAYLYVRQPSNENRIQKPRVSKTCSIIDDVYMYYSGVYMSLKYILPYLLPSPSPKANSKKNTSPRGEDRSLMLAVFGVRIATLQVAKNRSEQPQITKAKKLSTIFNC